MLNRSLPQRGGPQNQTTPTHSIASLPNRPGYRTRGYKRPFDLSILAVGHILFAPFWLLLWTVIPLAVWAADRGPVFYTQRRLGENGKTFTLIKFRTMIRHAEDSTGPVWAADDDRRVTRVGRVLRRFKLDEMPQVLNIWKGEMSLVGPRPERPELEEQFSAEIPYFAARLRVRPGVAGLAQAKRGYALRPRDKLCYDNLYIEKMGPLLDFKLLFLSVLAVLFRGRNKFW